VNSGKTIGNLFHQRTGSVDTPEDILDLTRPPLGFIISIVEQSCKYRSIPFEVYPELSTNVANGKLVLAIETDVDLGRQIKVLKIVDKRK
jgi:hypothetical protein